MSRVGATARFPSLVFPWAGCPGSEESLHTYEIDKEHFTFAVCLFKSNYALRVCVVRLNYFVQSLPTLTWITGFLIVY